MSTLRNHPQYDRTLDDVKMVRDCIEGEAKIKYERQEYLKHPDMIDATSQQALARYEAYIQGAEFEEYPAETERSILGAMTSGKATIEVPQALEYLVENCDGDGMPMAGLYELLYKNQLEVKYHILVAEMASLQSVGITDTENMSQAEYAALGLKASIKSYSRESLVDWDFERINGVMQLSLVVLEEKQTVRDKGDLSVKHVTSRLVLGLDDEGKYYQKKMIRGDDGAFESAEPFYPKVGGSELSWLPVEIVVDEETPAGKMPAATGYLRPVCAGALYRYRVSADEKEALRHMQPTTFTSGWKQGDFDLFKTLNGRDYIAFGAGVSNNMPNGVEVDIKGLGVEIDPFYKYYDRNARKLSAFGANTGEESRQAKTATEAASDVVKRIAIMNSIANNTERALTRMVSYCGMFMGLWSPDNVEDSIKQISIKLPREFSKMRITAEDVNSIVTARTGGLISKREAIRKLVDGGFTIEDAETIMDELEEEGAQPMPLPNTQQNEESQI